MISFVYFDLGGVVGKDFSASNKWNDLQVELGIAPTDAYEQFWKDVERNICTTQPVDSLLPILKEKFGAKVSNNYSLLNAFVKRFEKNESIWSVIEEIHKTTEIGLLTMMYPHMLDAIKKNNILSNIQWNVIIDSSEVKLVKSDPQMYYLAQEKVGVPSSQILFIENTKRYVDIARSLGWQTFLYNSANYEESSRNLLEYWSSLH